MKAILPIKNRVAHKIKAFIGVALVLLPSGLTASSAFAWGPERTLYTNANPADYATFNSIENNVAVGDERNFVRVRELGTDATYSDEVEVTPGKEYEVYVYYHNDAASDTNDSGFGIATDTRLASAYPTLLKAGERGMISGIISWSYVTPSDPNNAKTGTVWDEAYLTTKAKDGVILRYKTASAIIHNSGEANGSVLPTDLFTENGTPLGFNKLAGTIPGCAEFSGHVTYTLIAEKTDISLEKQVSLDGENWSESVMANPGDVVTYKITFKNIGNTTLTNVIFKDTHSDKLALSTGTTKVYDVNNVNGKSIDDILDISGYNVGDVAPGALVQLIYQLRVADDADCGEELKNTISADYNSTERVTDDASVTVKGECNKPVVDCTTNPELPECKTIPNTGPVEVILAIVIVAGIGGGGFYFYRSRKTLNNVKSKVSGTGTTPPETPTTPTDHKDTPENK